jgi:23S rRNA pseudouridine2605 synthase
VFQRQRILQDKKWLLVGRLDINSLGLLLFTNNGELANQLMHPSSGLDREYAVRVFGEADPATLKKLQEGVYLEDGWARFAAIKDAGGQGRNHWYYVTLYEGRNREVRRLWESQGFQVSRLIRVGFGPLVLPSKLKQGQITELSAEDIKTLTESMIDKTD